MKETDEAVSKTEDSEERLAQMIARLVADEVSERIISYMEQKEKRHRKEDRRYLWKVPVELLNIDQTAKYLGRSTKSIRDLVRAGTLEAVRVDRNVQFSRKKLDEFITRHGG